MHFTNKIASIYLRTIATRHTYERWQLRRCLMLYIWGNSSFFSQGFSSGWNCGDWRRSVL